MTCASALSTASATNRAIVEAVARLAEGLSIASGGPADLALAFASAHHAGGLAALSEALRGRGLARHVIGCTGESIVGDGREVEGGPALSLWAIRRTGLDVRPIRLAVDGEGIAGWPDDPGDPGLLILLGDPFTFPADPFLTGLREAMPGLAVVGGMASAAQSPGGNRLVVDGETVRDGAVGVLLGGPLAVRTIVSQGCRPIGRPMLVTKVEGPVVKELGRRPAVERFRELFETLDEADRARVRGGLHLGRVINEYQETFDRGDFLVRNVLGADDEGGLAVGEGLRVGQTVQFHVRDAEAADEDLRTLLARDAPARAGGALLFTCNGRGTRLFDAPDHDAAALRDRLGPVPVAGFFAMGEIGPIGGQNFVHGFTASIAVFETDDRG